jgi:Holliday junction resolvase
MGGKLSRNKGKRGERGVAHLLIDHGFPAKRGQQFSGSPDSPDVICESLPLHVEVKRTEKLSLYPVMEKAQADAGDQPAVVFHRRNKKPWLVIMDARQFLTLFNTRNSSGSHSKTALDT